MGRTDDTGREAGRGDRAREAAQGTGEKVSGLVEDDDLRQTLDRMVKEAKETEERCTALADELDGKRRPSSRRRARRSRRRPR